MRRVLPLISLAAVAAAAIWLWPPPPVSEKEPGAVVTPRPAPSLRSAVRSKPPANAPPPAGLEAVDSVLAPATPSASGTPAAAASSRPATPAGVIVRSRTALQTPTATPVPGFLTAEEASAISAPEGGSAARTRNSHMLPGVVRRSAPAPRPVSAAVPQEEEAAPPAPTPLPVLGGQARGYTMLSLMEPAARASVERQLQALEASRIQRVYLGALIDGSFGEDFGYLASVVQRLAENNQELVLALYLTNGASMREENNVMKGKFLEYDPESFRTLIVDDPVVRNQFLQIAVKARRIFELNTSLNASNVNIAIPMLEDNLDWDSYHAMRELARRALGDSALIIRNPCPGCRGGNDPTSHGDGLELHKPEQLSALAPGDGFTLDGTGYYFPNEEPGLNQMSLEQTRQLAAAAAAADLRYFGLWRAARQGLYSGRPRQPSHERQYEVPSDEQLRAEIELLREGLSPVEPEPQPDY